MAERLDGLEADEAGTDDDGLVRTRLEHRAQDVRVRHGAQRAHLWTVEPGQRGDDRVCARGQHEGVVVDLQLGAGGEVADSDATALAVDGDHLVADAHVDVERVAQGVGRLQQQLSTVGDLAADVVGQAAVGEGDVLAALEDDDLRGLVEPAQPRRRRHPAGHSTHDHDLHDCSLLDPSGRSDTIIIYPQGYPWAPVWRPPHRRPPHRGVLT